jgi:hypothetical protein
MALVMCCASAETHFASSAVRSPTDHAHARLLQIGKQKIQTKVKTLLGSWLTQNNVPSAGNQLRKIRDAII